MPELQSKSLFRKQALAHQKDRLTGDVIVSQPLSFSALTLFILLLLAISVVFLALGEYTRKEVVKGYLVPDMGVLKTYAPRMGKVTKLHVNEGDRVRKGDPLITLVSEQSLLTGDDAGQERLGQIMQQIAVLELQQQELHALHGEQLDELTATKAFLQQELVELKQQQTALEARETLFRSQLDDIERVFRAGHVTKSDFVQHKQRVLAAQQESQQLRALVVKSRLALKKIDYKLLQAPFEFNNRQLELQRQIAALKHQSLTEETNHRLVLRAAANGTVSSIQVKEGESLVATMPLISVLPDDATLHAELWLPTRAAGFVGEGQAARIRFDAFPHQRFGVASGELAVISKSIVSPEEAKLPVRLQEPVYRVIVELDEQYIVGYGKSLPLQAGMMLEADIVLDTRNLLDWLLDPLYSLRGRV
ncbi:HlyD family efflux transporter periplasmic adaptor subunit [Neiella sp. HB171785]|uniref:HlyD family efflux transporter periplasmic adaptor subunit n=1 Tax=Neiella litorisoli TaxID=2771431 RepID=A0A8J6UQ17_9GAMM|nr:HlyD family efflux transporter periplasmic adaptor subunit [Neiella litorisoli]MBD1390032.1 HlyD family efflux transporter periplasmic adaptor subunit [Neiella litorisoli]